MNIKKLEDLKFGLKNEEKILTIIRKYFKSNTIFKTTYTYDQYDFIDKKNKIIIELKSRRIKKLQYHDIMIGLNKITEGFKHIKNGYTTYLFFSFTDTISFYELNSKTYKKSWERIGGRIDRNKNEICKCSYIPTTELIDININ